MQQIHFEREQLNNYMVIPCAKQLNRTYYGEMVLEYAHVPGFMNYEIREIDGKQSLYYKLQYRTSLKQVLDSLNVTKELMETMIDSIVQVMKQTEEYLLDIHFILWKSEAIFIDVASGKLLFAYYPHMCVEGNSVQSLLTELFQYVEKSNRQVYLYLMEFYDLVTNPECSMEQLEQYRMHKWNGSKENVLEEDNDKIILDKEIVITDSKESVKKETIEKPLIAIALMAAVNVIVATLLLFNIWTYQYIWVLIITLFLLFVTFLTYHSGDKDEDIDMIMEEYLRGCDERQSEMCNEVENIENTETTVLCTEYAEIVKEEGPKELFLKSMYPKEYKDLIMDKHNIVLGCLERNSDYILKQRGISRMHAKLIKKEDGLFLMDLNATNGTYLNEEQLVGGKEYLLEEGDVISLAKVVTFVVVEREN